tara:strand:+ start:1027 stop:1992 length:966 start_codon:yes stop_codon:yes gene_type:complete
MVLFNKSYGLNDILDLIEKDKKFVGNEKSVRINNVALRETHNSSSLDWCGLDNVSGIIKYLKDSKAGLTLVSYVDGWENISHACNQCNLLFVKSPKLEFARLFNLFKVSKRRSEFESSNNFTVDQNTLIGDNFVTGSNVVIGNAKIGSNVEISHNTVILDGVEIGDNVIIGASSVIGSEGFGYVTDYDGSLLKFPHIGGVLIGSNVEIGSNVCIDRGSLVNTIIDNGVKIDNLVHIAHNVHIGSDSHIIANAMIAGSVQIGKRVWIAPSVNILEHLSVGDDAKIGVGSVVTKSVPQGETWTGVPAREISVFLRQQSKLKAL